MMTNVFISHGVRGNLDGVLNEIQSPLTPTPAPSPQGGGEARQLSKRALRLPRKERH
jgi:hypothetical protein